MTGNNATILDNTNTQTSSSQLKDLSRYVPEKRRKPEIGLRLFVYVGYIGVLFCSRYDERPFFALGFP